MKRRREHGDLAVGGPKSQEALEQVADDLTDRIVEQLQEDAAKLREMLVEAEKRVSRQDWEIWLASYVEGQATKDIAAKMGKSQARSTRQHTVSIEN